MLPTPRERDWKGRGYEDGLPNTLLALLPTPSASLANYDEPPETWLARREELKAKGINGNGAGMPLAVAMKLLPTPEASDGSGGRISKEKGGTRPSGAKRAVTLATAIHHQPVSPSTGESTSPQSGDGRPSTGVRLSPCFEEWMLGLPQGWSDPDCPLSATEFKSRSLRSSAPTSSSERPSA
jgi:hypothetical protein